MSKREDRRVLGIVALTAFSAVWLFASSSSAETREAFLDRMKDFQTTLWLEGEIAGHLDGGDKAALARMAREVRGQDKTRIVEVITAYQGMLDGMAAARRDPKRTGEPPQGPGWLTGLGPCHFAGLYVRLLGMGFSDGRFQSERVGATYVTKPRDPGELYGTSVRRSELLGRLPKSTRRVGATCTADGGGDGCE